jgi:bacterial/archaeal transporter family-2 protein
MVLIYMLLAFLGGVFLALQVGVNTQLRIWTAHSMYATFISIFVSLCTGALVLLFYIFTSNLPGLSFERLFQAPVWIWTGGILGALYVWFAIILAPRLEATVFLGLIVTGQFITSLVIDHYGLLDFPHHPINLWRALGVVLLISGVILIRRF